MAVCVLLAGGVRWRTAEASIRFQPTAKALPRVRITRKLSFALPVLVLPDTCPLFCSSSSFIALRNQAMRKKLILYFKRRNHARKQWVSRALGPRPPAVAQALTASCCSSSGATQRRMVWWQPCLEGGENRKELKE